MVSTSSVQYKGCYRVQARETPRGSRNQILHILRGVGGHKRERHIAVVWLYPASKPRIIRFIAFKAQHPIEKRSSQPFLFSRESCSLLLRCHQRTQVQRYVRRVSLIQQLGTQMCWQYNSQRVLPHCIDQMVVTDPNLVIAQSNDSQKVS